MKFFLDGGFFMPVILLLGLVALGLNVMQLRDRSKQHYTGLIVGLIGATLFVGIVGTGIGLYQGGQVLETVEAARRTALLGKIFGIAMTTLSFAAIFGAINALLCGVAHVRKQASSSA